MLRSAFSWLKNNTLLLLGLLGTLLAVVLFRNKESDERVISQDVDSNGENDNQQIEEIQREAQAHRDAAQQNVQAAQAAVAAPTAVTPSKTVNDAVQRNNEIDY